MKSFAPDIARSLGWIGLISLGMTGCMQTPAPTEEKAVTQAEPTPLTAERDQPSPTALEWTDPATGKAYLKDPVSGQAYELNPNRKVLTPPGAAAGLAKAAGATNSQFDWSGRVETRWYECNSGTPAAFNLSITCQVEPGFTLVGGGAYVDYGTGQGALLTETRPLDGNFVTWAASSKQHLRTNAHTLYVYAIGLRLKMDNGSYMATAALRAYLSYGSSTSTTPLSYPYGYNYDLRRGYLLLGGGVKVNWSGSGNLLVRSLPGTCLLGTEPRNYACRSYDSFKAETWHGLGKDQGSSSPATITVSSFHITDWIPGFGSLESKTISATTSAGATVPGVAKVSSLDGWVMACPGADANPTDLNPPPNRLLFGLRPEFQSQGRALAAAYSKDHVSAGAGSLMVTATQLRKRP